MKKTSSKFGIAAGVILVLVLVLVLLSLRDVENYHYKYEGVDLTKDVEGMERTGTYTGYLLAHEERQAYLP